MKHNESLSQIALVEWFSLQYPSLKKLLVASMVGVNLPVSTRNRMRRMGCKAGVPDLQLMVPRIYPLKLKDENGHLRLNEKRFSPGLFIEMKDESGVLSSIQKEFHELLLSQGYTINTCYSFEDGKKAITEYLKGYSPKERELRKD